jgi:hypothetical protein
VKMCTPVHILFAQFDRGKTRKSGTGTGVQYTFSLLPLKLLPIWLLYQLDRFRFSSSHKVVERTANATSTYVLYRFPTLLGNLSE